MNNGKYAAQKLPAVPSDCTVRALSERATGQDTITGFTLAILPLEDRISLHRISQEGRITDCVGLARRHLVWVFEQNLAFAHHGLGGGTTDQGAQYVRVALTQGWCRYTPAGNIENFGSIVALLGNHIATA